MDTPFLVIPVVAYCNQRRLDRIPGLCTGAYMPTTQSTCTHARLSTVGINYVQRLPAVVAFTPLHCADRHVSEEYMSHSDGWMYANKNELKHQIGDEAKSRTL